jgi:transglutaminase-like putative cysteine protease
MNKFLLLFLILVSLSFSENSFGSSTIEMERTWTIDCPVESCFVDFRGMLVVNNSNQRVISITTEPHMDIRRENSEIRVLYAETIDKGVTVLKASVLLEVDYDTALRGDFPLAPQEVNSTDLTEYNDAIARRARSLTENDSVLNTLRNSVEWVHQNIEYDLGYFGISDDAKTVFVERRGVCTEYSHLLISMLNSLGIKTRYVNGYVVGEDWQPHAWVEAYIPEYGWLPLDPTFNQAGILDSSHVIISYGVDQKSVYDSVTSQITDIVMDSETNLGDYAPVEDPKGLDISIEFDDATYVTTVSITNNRNEYIFGSHQFSSPEKYWGVSSELLLISPFGTVEKNYPVDYESLPEGYIYTIPVKASVNDAEASEQIVIRKSLADERDIKGDLCSNVFILALLPVILWLRETSL